MPQISQETKEQILAATDIVDVIGSYLDIKRASSRYLALCPFHNEKSPSFNIIPQRQMFYCFGCKKSGDAITFVREYENLTYVDAIKKLAARAGITVTEEAFDPKEDRARRQRGKQLDLHREVAAFFHSMLFKQAAKHAREYLKSRGFGKEMAERWTIGWAPDRGDVFLDWARDKKFSGRDLVDAGLLKQGDRGVYAFFRDRLMFPIRNEHGDVIAFSGRKLREDPRDKSGKYVNSPETVIFKKSNVLFALERARKAILKENAVVVCEGQIDAICCHEQGIEHVVGCQGSALTHEHARLLRRYAKNAILCYDSDKPGLDATEKGFRELAAEGIPCRVARMPAGEDPDSFMRKNGPEAFRGILANAVSFFDFKIDRANDENRLTDLQQRSVFARECATFLAAIQDPVSREDLINHVATRLRTGAPELRDAVLRAARAAKNKPAARDRNAPPEPEIVTPMSLDPVVGYLCSLALRSPAVQEWLGEQFESVHEAAEHVEGIPLLEAILSARPDPTSHVAVNGFIGDLPESQRLALLSDPTFHGDPPDDAVKAAETALAELSAKALHRRDASIQAQLQQPGLPNDKMIQLLQEKIRIAELLKGVKQRFVFNDRFAPSWKPVPKPFYRKNPPPSGPENKP